MGALLAQVLGNALAEEIAFRFFLTQLALKFDRPAARRRGSPPPFSPPLSSPSRTFPNRLFLFEMSGWEMAQDQLRLFVMGLLFSGSTS